MYRKVFIVSGLITCLFLLTGDSVRAQELINDEGELAPTENNDLEIVSGPEVQWLLGRVVSVDAQNKTLAVKYPDYESDNEKNITITTDEDTTYENAKSLTEIKGEDMVNIDYISDVQGRNIARNVSLEKLENASAVNLTEDTEIE